MSLEESSGHGPLWKKTIKTFGVRNRWQVLKKAGLGPSTQLGKRLGIADLE